MSGPAFNIHIGTTADLAALVKSAEAVNNTRAAAEAVNRLEGRLAQRAFDRLSTAERINRLKQQEAQLAAAAVRLEGTGNQGGAAQLNLAVLQKREQIERLTAEQQRERDAAQARTAAEAARQQQQALAAQHAAASQLAAVRARLGQLQRQEKEEAFAQLPLAEQINQLMARRADLARRLAQAQQGGTASERTQLAYQIAQAENDARLRALQRQQAAAAPPSLGTQFKDGFTALGGQFAAGLGIAALGGKLVQSAREVFHFADRISDLSDRMGVSAETAQELEYAATKTGTSLEVVSQSFKALTVAQGQAQGGSKEYAEAFKLLGVSTDDLKNKGTEQLFNQLAASIGKGPQGAQQLTAALKLLGRSSEQLMPAFRAGFTDLMTNAREAGAVIDEDVVKQLDAAADNSELLGKQLKASLAPALAVLSEWATSFLNKFRQIAVFVGTLFGSLAGGRSPRQAFEDATDAVAHEINRQERERDERPRPDARREREADRAARVAALEEQLRAATAQAEEAGLTREERRTRLLERQAELRRLIAAEADQERRLQLQVEEQAVAAKLKSLETTPARAASSGIGAASTSADRLQRMGGLVGSAATDPVRAGLADVSSRLGEVNRQLGALVARVNRPLDVNFPEQ